MKHYYIKTFGCQMNEHDTAKMHMLLAGLGLEPVDTMNMADLILFNTCTIRDKAQQKAYSDIGRAARLKRHMPELKIGVCGCVAQQRKEAIFKQFPCVDLIFGPDQIHQLPELLHQKKGLATDLIDDPGQYVFVNQEKSSTSSKRESSAFVKIMKGCNNKCTFCIVPSVRGVEVSRPVADVIAEINTLVTEGIKEVTLLGQNVNSYQSDTTNGALLAFPDLIRKISSETDILRIRYVSPHPRNYSDALIEEHASNPKLCKSVHLPLQSGSNEILKKMKRTYNREQYLKIAKKLRAAVPNIEISADIIVGFPSETDQDFADTLDVIEQVKFDQVYSFHYSPRPGTKAAEMIDDVPKEVKSRRLDQVLSLHASIWESRKASFLGTVQDILVEGRSKTGDFYTGRTFANKIVNFEGTDRLIGEVIPVEITRTRSNSLDGAVLTI